MTFVRFALVALFLASASACSDGAVAYSEPVGVHFGFKDGDVKSGTYEDGKNINTESGNPYQVFLTQAHSALGGANPSRIEITQIELFLDSSSTGATSFADVFASLDIYVDDLAGHTYTVGHLEPVTNALPLDIPITANADAITALQPVFQTGQFKIGVRATTPNSLPATFDLKETLEMTFRALP